MSDHLDQLDQAKLMQEDPDRWIAELLGVATDSVQALVTQARDHYGSSIHGHSVNEPLVGLYRELAEAERALANAKLAHKVLHRERRDAAATAAARKKAPRP